MFSVGDRLKHPNKPDCGLGQVFSICPNGKLYIFFVGAGRICLNPQYVSLVEAKESDAQCAILDTLDNANFPFGRHNIYVIEMSRAILSERRFTKENPNRDPTKPCVYVGMTWHTPEERFQQHMNDKHAAHYVYRYRQGAKLLYPLFQKFNPMHKRLAEMMEVERACQLRKQGYAVWQR
ncbi:MAG TPA: DUF3553 domain-containing protein [Pyrinomonadaceae bacterium]|jgi:hypothetical protein